MQPVAGEVAAEAAIMPRSVGRHQHVVFRGLAEAGLRAERDREILLGQTFSTRLMPPSPIRFLRCRAAIIAGSGGNGCTAVGAAASEQPVEAPIPTTDERIVAAVRAAGAIVLGKTNTPEFGAGANTRNAVFGATGNPFSGSLRNPAAFSGIVGFRPTPGLVANERRGLGWNNLSVAGPMARTVPDLCLLLSTMVSDDRRDPLATTVHGRTVRWPEDFAVPARIDLSRMRVAATPDFGFAPTERHIAEVFAEKTGLFRHVLAHVEEATPDCTGADEAFEVLRAIGFLASHAEKVRTRPQDVGPNVRANVAEGQRYSAADVARAQTLQTMLYRRWQDFFRDKDVILTPSITISPRSWRELYPAEIDGKPTRTYFHWLALAYAVTLPGHPAVSLPVGLDRHGMPFGLQIVGPRGGDAFVLSVAAELEAMLAADARTARPVPDLVRLKAARPIGVMSGFLGFD
jgi:amidase